MQGTCSLTAPGEGEGARPRRPDSATSAAAWSTAAGAGGYRQTTSSIQTNVQHTKEQTAADKQTTCDKQNQTNLFGVKCLLCRDCKSKLKRENAYRFAVCFICKEEGHLAKVGGLRGRIIR